MPSQRLGELANSLSDKIGGLATDLGKDTVQLVIMDNDPNVSKDAVSNFQLSYILKREAFLAGLATLGSLHDGNLLADDPCGF